jgi:hypothetical protein
VREVKEVKEGVINGVPMQVWRYLDDFEATEFFQQHKPAEVKLEIVPFFKVFMTDGRPRISEPQRRMCTQLLRYLIFLKFPKPSSRDHARVIGCKVATAYEVQIQVDPTGTRVEQAWKNIYPGSTVGEPLLSGSSTFMS